MGPEHIAALVESLIALISITGTTPLLVVILSIILVPWIILVLISLAQKNRFEAVVTMYENNFQQVEVTQGLARDFKDMAMEQKDLVIMASTSLEAMHGSIENNMHCPIVRKNAKPKDIKGSSI